MTTRIQIEKKDGLFNLKAIYRWFSGQIDGTYRLDISRVRRYRSNDQNGWLWGCIYPMMLEGLIEQGWEFTSTEEVHEYFKTMLTARKVVNRHTGEVVEFPGSTAVMDTVTFASYCGLLRDYAKEYLGIEIPEPDGEESETED